MRKRSLDVSFRFGLYLLREFRLQVLVFLTLVFGGGALIHFCYEEPPKTDVQTITVSASHPSYVEGCYGTLLMIFTQNYFRLPNGLPMQIFFFLVPIVGLGAVADSMVRLGYLIFSNKRKLQEWWIMQASTYRNHLVVVGLGRVGYRIAQELRALGEDFVAIEKNRESMFVEEMLGFEVPVILGEARLKKTLESANVGKARAIILATDDDLANMDAALTARELNPDIRVVVRLFDDTLATKVAASFGLPAISTSQVSAPAFVAAATGRSVLHSFQLDGQKISVADVQVAKLATRTVAQIQREFDISVVLHRAPGKPDLQPAQDRAVQAGDTIVILAPADRIHKVEAANRG